MCLLYPLQEGNTFLLLLTQRQATTCSRTDNYRTPVHQHRGVFLEKQVPTGAQQSQQTLTPLCWLHA